MKIDVVQFILTVCVAMCLGAFVGMVGMYFHWAIWHTYTVATIIALLCVYFLGARR